VPTAATVISSFLAVAFLLAGGTKVANLGPHEEEFNRYELPALPPQVARVLVGGVELSAMALLAVAAIASSTTVAVIGAAVVIATMAGALATHVRLGDPASKMAPPVILGLLAVALIVIAA
jgi:putative oxidoreductase